MKKNITENEIKNMVRNSLLEFISNNEFNAFETKTKSHDTDEKQVDDDEVSKETRDSIEAFFKQPGVNCAAYAYELYGVESVEGDDTDEMKNARSKFMKCLNHDKNDAGYDYSFSSKELNRLADKIASSSNMNENRIMKAVNESLRMFKEQKMNKNRTKRN